MTTKLRSACDKCHQNKVRCSGEIPCQVCLASGTLCLYSVSNPLGRPRGTKNKQHNRARSTTTENHADISINSTCSTNWSSNALPDRDLQPAKRPESDQSPAARPLTTFPRIYQDRIRKDRIKPHRSLHNHDRGGFPDHSRQHSNSQHLSPYRPAVNQEQKTSEASSENVAGSATCDLTRARCSGGVLGMSTQSMSSNNTLNKMDRDDDEIVDFSTSDFAFSTFNYSLSPSDDQSTPSWDGSTVYTSDNDMGNLPSDLLWMSPQVFDFQKSVTMDDYEIPPEILFDDFLHAVDTSQTQKTSSSDAKHIPASLEGTMDIAEIDLDKGPHEPVVSTTDISADMAATAVTLSLSSASIPTHLTSTTCTCAKQHAELLSHSQLSEMLSYNDMHECNNRNLSIDTALSLSKQGIKTWQNLISCPYCPYSDDQEVMLLTFMTIRATIRYLQRLWPHYTFADSGGTSQTHHSKDSITPSKTSHNLPAQSISIPEPIITDREESLLTIGTFEVTGNERILVLRVLVQNILHKVKATLHSLQLIQDKKKQRLLRETSRKGARIKEHHESSNLYYIQQISHKLLTSIQSLESSLNNQIET